MQGSGHAERGYIVFVFTALLDVFTALIGACGVLLAGVCG